MAFNGTSQYLDLASTSAVNTTLRTYSALIYPYSTSVYQPILGDANASGGPSFRLGNTGNIQFVKQGIALIGQSTAVVSANMWSHVALTYDAAGNLKLYINGQDAGGASTSLTTFSPSGARVGYDGFGPLFYNGTIASIVYHNRILSPAEIAWLAAEPFAMLRPLVRRQYFIGGVGGGGAFTGSLSDTAATSDGFSGTMAATGSLADTTATSDARSGVMSAAGSFTGTASTSDTWAGVGAFTGSFAGTASTSDTWSAVGAFVGSLSDSTATSDQFSVIVSGAYSGSWSDTAATSDAFTAAMAASGALSDSAATSTTFSAAMAATGSFTGTASTSDSFVFIPAGAYTGGWADTVATTDMWTATLGGGGPVAPGTGISLSALTALLSSLPTTLPSTPGVLWMNGRILCISL